MKNNLKKTWEKHNIKTYYRSSAYDKKKLLNEFYNPLLSSSILYQRTAGYFSSSSLAAAAIGFYDFIINGGKMKLIVGEMSLRKDRDRIREMEHYTEAEEIEEFWKDRGKNAFMDKHVDLLGWMMKKGNLEIKIAKRTGRSARDIFHEKEGLFHDGMYNWIGFGGSNNESLRGWMESAETYHVKNSWKKDPDDVEDMKKVFDDRWNAEGEVDGWTFVPIYEHVKNKMESNAPDDPLELGLIEEYKELGIGGVSIERKEERFSLREHQERAIEYWKDNGFVGIFEMATGSGKTFTALRALRELPDDVSFHFIVAPRDAILEQWKKEISREYAGEKGGFEIISSTEGSGWKRKAEIATNSTGRKYFILVSTDSARPDHRKGLTDFVDCVKRVEGRSSIILDEVHRFGSTGNKKILDETRKVVNHKLGLSATPERSEWLGGDADIREYFDRCKNFEYSLKDAIKDGQLCSYDYKIYRCHLDDEESAEYVEYSSIINKKIARFRKMLKLPDHAGIHTIMRELKRRGMHGEASGLSLDLINRSRTLKVARNKMIPLLEILDGIIEEAENGRTRKCFIYGESEEHLDTIMQNVDSKNLWYRKVTFGNKDEHEEALRQFEQREQTSFLAAIRILDEGVDVPMCDSAILLSNTQEEREFIQRRGRVLRVSHREGCEYDSQRPAERTANCDDLCKLHSEIHDIIILPPRNMIGYARSIVEPELDRMENFIDMARNKDEATRMMQEIRELFTPS